MAGTAAGPNRDFEASERLNIKDRAQGLIWQSCPNLFKSGGTFPGLRFSLILLICLSCRPSFSALVCRPKGATTQKNNNIVHC